MAQLPLMRYWEVVKEYYEAGKLALNPCYIDPYNCNTVLTFHGNGVIGYLYTKTNKRKNKETHFPPTKRCLKIALNIN